MDYDQPINNSLYDERTGEKVFQSKIPFILVIGTNFSYLCRPNFITNEPVRNRFHFKSRLI